ncbi:MAG: ABC transporter permease [Holophagaceae bacterium]
MKFLHLVWKSLMRSKRRTFLILCTLLLSVFLITILQSLLATLDSISNKPTEGHRFVVRHKSGLTQFLPMSYGDYLRQQPEVVAVANQQWFGGYYQDPKNFFANFALDEATMFEVYSDRIMGLTDAEIKEFQRDGKGCIVGQILADKYGWKVGDTIPLSGTIFPINPRLTVRGIFKGRMASEENTLYFHYKLLEEGVPFMKGKTGSFWVKTKTSDDIPRLANRIDTHFANSPVETLSEAENAFYLTFVKMLGNISAIIHGVTIAVLIAITIVTVGTMSMAIKERTTEIAILRAMGFSSTRVLILLMAEGLLLVTLGGALGIGLARLVAKVLREVLGSSLIFLQDFYLANSTIVLCMGMALVIGFISTIIPALTATRKSIVEGLRAL